MTSSQETASTSGDAGTGATEASNPLEMDAETMRRLGYRVIDRLVDRITDLDRERVWSWLPRAKLAAGLGGPPPEQGMDPDALLRLIEERVLPYASRIDHPRFLGYVPGCPTWPGILGDLLASGYNIFAGTSQASSGPSVLELEVLRWFCDWLGYPADAGGLLTSGGSAANLDALVCAREWWRAKRGESGRDGKDAVVYFSDQTHSSVVRAARMIDIDASRLRELPTDADFKLDIGALTEAVDADERDGNSPFIVVANAGATSTGSIDPLAELADFCAEHGLWLHVDAAYGGFAILSEAGRSALRGIERADSIVLDPHKWLYQPFEVGCLLVREARLLADAFHILPDYLQDTAVGDAEVNFADRGLQLTRAARALKVWMSLRAFGVPAFTRVIERSLELAGLAAGLVTAHPELEPLARPALGVVCFRRHPPGVDDEAELERLNAGLVRGLAESGIGLISSTRLRGRYALRLCVLNHRTRASDVERVVEWLGTAGVDGRR